MSTSSSSSDAERTVLVVDDSAFMRRVISDMIDGFPGYRVVGTAADGRKALQTHCGLRPGGYLVLGRVETLGASVRDGFEIIDARERIFRRR